MGCDLPEELLADLGLQRRSLFIHACIHPSDGFLLSYYVPGTVLEARDSGTSLAVQWLRLRASTARGVGPIAGQGTKIPHAAAWPKKIKKI